jgi:hypothetical protein
MSLGERHLFVKIRHRHRPSQGASRLLPDDAIDQGKAGVKPFRKSEVSSLLLYPADHFVLVIESFQSQSRNLHCSRCKTIASIDDDGQKQLISVRAGPRANIHRCNLTCYA